MEVTLRSKASLLLVAAVAASGVVLALLLSARAEGGGSPPELVGMSNRGVPVQAAAGVKQVLEQTGTADGTLKRLGAKGDATFYLVEGTAHRGDCYGVARGAGPDHRLNSLTCSRQFPSGAMPVLDSSVYEETAGGARFDQLKGWTVNRVASIELRNEAGVTLLRRVPTDNFYYVPREVMPSDGVELAALDRAGSTIWAIEAG